MRFWDSSALVALLVDEPTSAAVRTVYRASPGIVVWWGCPVECASALGRREAEGSLSAAEGQEAAGYLGELESSWSEIPPTDQLRSRAVRLVRVHRLRTGDALQLAAALAASEERPATLDLVTLDERLALAARREGFTVLPG